MRPSTLEPAAILETGIAQRLAKHLGFSILIVLVLFEIGKADRSIDINVGLTPSKSILGLSYTNGMNQINAGLHGFAYHSSDGGYLMPGMAYNRYLTASGFYTTVNYNFLYVDQVSRSFVFNNGNIEVETSKQKGWLSGTLGAGLGKSFQFTRWGLHVDGGLATLANSQFAQAWGWWLSGAASYRFRLD